MVARKCGGARAFGHDQLRVCFEADLAQKGRVIRQ
jgi:hypothetical protein